MRILVTGGAGFIGSNIVKGYLDLGYEVFVVDDLSTGNENNIHVDASCFVHGSITDPNLMDEVCGRFKPELVNHHAAQTSVRKSVRSPNVDFVTNINGGFNVLKSAHEAGSLKSFIFASSGGSVYGGKGHRPYTEWDSILPESPYACSKHMFENVLATYGNLWKVKCQILRYSNVYGPGQDPNGECGAIAIWFGAIKKNEPLKLFGDGSQVRDYVHVSDVVDANLKAVNFQSSFCMNVSSAVGTETKNVLDMVRVIAGSPDHPILQLDRAEGDIDYSVLENTLIKNILSWTPKVPIWRKGLESVWEKMNND